jgi:hypothetical protein
MKKIVILILTVITSYSVIAQEGIGNFFRSVVLNTNVYKTKQDLLLKCVYDVTNQEAISSGTAFQLLVGTREYIRYRVLKSGDSPYIKFLPSMKFTATGAGYAIEVLAVGETRTSSSSMIGRDPTQYYFQMADKLEPNKYYLASQKITGLPLTIPLKLRKQDGHIKFSPSLSIGYAFGWKVRINNDPYKDKFLNVIAYGLGFNADKYQSRNADGTLSGTTDAISVTYWCSGLALEVNAFNYGIFLGKDRMFESNKNWIYQNKTWISLGFGYKFG